MLDLKIIIGSTRPGRAADLVAPWVIDRTRAHGGFSVDVLDLRDWPLPMFTETVHTVGDMADPTYSDPIVRRWNLTIKAADAFLVITPEYLHSVPGVLKNALDSVFVSYGMRNKPVGLVGYSGGPIGGARAVEHLAHIAIEAEAVPLRNTVLVGNVHAALVNGEPTAPGSDIALRITLDDLAWWGNALQAARRQGELPPGNARFRAALAT
jgi:NAD(P)H-dependent FMN reductase